MASSIGFRTKAAVLVATCSGSFACGSHAGLRPGTPGESDAGDAGVSIDGPADAEADTQSCTARIPQNHRATEGPGCPGERAPGPGLPAMCSVDGGQPPSGDCQKDSDCTKGVNGRCVVVRGCYMACSYDECTQDSDCAGNVPCQCRDSASSTASNWCLKNSNCRVDGDCGPGGYCTPSQLDGCMRMCTVPCEPGTHCYAGSTEVPCWCGQSCGAGYFCHTPCDSCTDDSDCSEPGSACTHQPTGGWACIACAIVL
jgi:hypothetical protein